MLDVLQFVFSSFWVFAGTCILLCFAGWFGMIVVIILATMLETVTAIMTGKAKG